jgi:hypothetical protein
MNKRSLLLVAILGLVFINGVASTSAFAASDLDSVIEVQIYNRAIHIMAMLLIGFGFLMVFVRGYGLSALTATYLMVAVTIPGDFLLKPAAGSTMRPPEWRAWFSPNLPPPVFLSVPERCWVA